MAGSPSSECRTPPTGVLRGRNAALALAQVVARAMLASAVDRAGSQADAAGTLGVARTYLNGLLNGRRVVSASFVDRLTALGVSVDMTDWLHGLLIARPEPQVEPPTHPDEALHTIRRAYELQFGHPVPGDRPSPLALSDIPEAAGRLATGLGGGHPSPAHLQVQALLLRSYAQVLLGHFADALWCGLCAERLAREALRGHDRTFALAQAAIAASQAYLALGLREPHARAAATVLAAATELPSRMRSGLPLVGQRAHLGGLLHQRRPSSAEIRYRLADIERRVASGGCREGDGDLELLLSYPLAMQAAVARGNRLNLRWAEALSSRGREILERGPGAFGAVPQLGFLEAEAGVMEAIGDHGGRRRALVAMRHLAEAHGLQRQRERAAALLARS